MERRREFMMDTSRIRGQVPTMLSVGPPQGGFKARTYVPTKEAYINGLRDRTRQVEWLLPMVEEAERKVTDPKYTECLWSSGLLVHRNLRLILDQAAWLLHGDAFQDHGHETAPSHTRFLEPMVFQQGAGSFTSTQYPCMLFSPAKVKQCLDFRMMPSGYVYATLGHDARGQCIEAMHRLIMYAIYGPPPEGCSVVMHACQNPMCGNPLHLLWGTQMLNARAHLVRGRPLSPERPSDSEEKRAKKREDVKKREIPLSIYSRLQRVQHGITMFPRAR